MLRVVRIIMTDDKARHRPGSLQNSMEKNRKPFRGQPTQIPVATN
jgi:hypothetical protein